jgi:hypothetical protein
MKQPPFVILDTNAVLERFQDFVGDYVSDDETLLETIVRQLCSLLEEWETADVFIQEVALDLIDALALSKTSVKGLAVMKGVFEIAHELIKKIEHHGLVKGGLFYYEFQQLQGYNVVLRSTI